MASLPRICPNYTRSAAARPSADGLGPSVIASIIAYTQTLPKKQGSSQA